MAPPLLALLVLLILIPFHYRYYGQLLLGAEPRTLKDTRSQRDERPNVSHRHRGQGGDWPVAAWGRVVGLYIAHERRPIPRTQTFSL